MLEFKILRWGNAFSYGDYNEIILNANPLTQIVGKNGHGKTSIPSILEELLYNKNSKNIKKSAILNRYLDAKFYWIEGIFSKDGNEYRIYTKRGSTQSVKLECNGIDISGHTSTSTYKLIEEVIGYDHKTFSQIVYQSSASSLEFLKATDTTRKKFLIDLLNLTRYTETAEVFKSLVKDISNVITGDKSSLATVDNWLLKLSKENMQEMELVEAPPPPDDLLKEITALEIKLSTIDNDNKLITQNNKYKEILDNITLFDTEQPAPDRDFLDRSAVLRSSISKCQSELELHRRKAGITSCSACGSPINNETHKQLVQTLEKDLIKYKEELETISNILDKIEKDTILYNKAQNSQLEWEKYHRLYDPRLPTNISSARDIATKVNELKTSVKQREQGIKTATEHNIKASAHNSRIKVLASQKVEMLEEKNKLLESLSMSEKLLNIRQILVKTFSTTGLVAYKIECLVKDLENITNDYLVSLSDGRFQISFKVSSSDKLNVIITDNGSDIDIEALSGGELARVNVATLLAIRKLMQAISNSRTNLLILDETIDNLDADGKDKLVEILLTEEYLSTFIVSHGFTHPLLEKLNVIKENNISRIDHG